MADTNVHVIPRPCFFLCPSSSPLSSRHFLARIPLDAVKPSFQNLSIEFIYAFMVTRVTHSNTCLCLRKCFHSFRTNSFFPILHKVVQIRSLNFLPYIANSVSNLVSLHIFSRILFFLAWEKDKTRTIHYSRAENQRRMNNRKGLLPLRTASYDLLYHVSGGRGRTWLRYSSLHRGCYLSQFNLSRILTGGGDYHRWQPSRPQLSRLVHTCK